MRTSPNSITLLTSLALPWLSLTSASADQLDLFTYEVTGSAVTITEYLGRGSDHVEIPPSIEGLPVTSIGDSAFASRPLRSITIPSSVTSIGDTAFLDCDWLASVEIPSSVNSIGNYAFAYCYQLASLTLQEGLTSIGDGAFHQCRQLMSVTIPGSITSIGYEAFAFCGQLKSVTISAGVTSIGQRMFLGCIQLTSVTIPEGVTSISNGAFSVCSALPSVTIPESVTSIEDQAFFFCLSLTSMVIPDGVTSIGTEGFWACENLASVSLGRGLLSIGWNAFLDTAIPFHEQSGFLYLTSATAAFLVDGRSASGDLVLSSTFNGLPVRSVNAFRGSKNLTSITIPASVANIDRQTFDNCDSLEAIHVDEANPNYADHEGALIDLATDTLLRVPEGTGASYSIPNGLTRIGDYAFHQCSGLTSVTIPSGVTSIGAYAFHKCSKLTSATVPAGVTSIGDNAFYKCTELTSLLFLGNFPSSVGYGALGFPRLSDLTIYYLVGSTGFTSPTMLGFPSVEIDLAATPAAPWLIEHGVSHEATLEQDLNGDGVSLLMAYALKLDPNQNLQSALPVPTIDGANLGMTFHGIRPGITYTVETSTDLQNWSTTGVTVSEPDVLGQISVTVELDAPRRFLRLVVSN